MKCEGDNVTFCAPRQWLHTLLNPQEGATTFYDLEDPPTIDAVMAGQLEALRNLGSWLLGPSQPRPMMNTLLEMSDQDINAALQEGINKVANHPYFTALLFVLAVMIRKYERQKTEGEAQGAELAALKKQLRILEENILILKKEHVSVDTELAITKAQLVAIYAIQGRVPPVSG